MSLRGEEGSRSLRDTGEPSGCLPWDGRQQNPPIQNPACGVRHKRKTNNNEKNVCNALFINSLLSACPKRAAHCSPSSISCFSPCVWSLYVTGWKNPFPDFSPLVSSVYRQLELPTSRKLSGRKSHFPEHCVSGGMSNCRALSHRQGGSVGKGSTGTAEPKKGGRGTAAAPQGLLSLLQERSRTLRSSRSRAPYLQLLKNLVKMPKVCGDN